MVDATFEKLGLADRCLYGTRKLLLCGFAAAAQSKFKTLLEILGIRAVPLLWGTSEDVQETVGVLLARPDGSGEGVDSELPRAIIVAGLEENELHTLMSGCRQAGMRQALWAALTPTSESWPLGQLLKELSTERAALAKDQ
ncbi:MAG: DUF3783 domain-containing protein [Desulfatitalea sp.]|nr:DUF3783 domain-containing protein [Desulfatitalea sp.]